MTKEEKKEYNAKYYAENKGKYASSIKKYRDNNKEKLNEMARKYRETHKEEYKEYYKRFKEKNNWVEYCANARRRRVERLRAEGCTNAWSVINGAEPKYKKVEED